MSSGGGIHGRCTVIRIAGDAVAAEGIPEAPPELGKEPARYRYDVLFELDRACPSRPSELRVLHDVG